MEDFSPHVELTWKIRSEGSLSAAMRAHGLRRLATLCEVSPQTMCNWAAGMPVPDWAMGRICNAIGWSRPLVRYRALATGPNGKPIGDGVSVAEIGWVGGIVKKARGRKPATAPVATDEPAAVAANG